MRKVYQDRLAVIQKFTKFEQFWQASEDELMLLRAQLADCKENNEKLQEMNNTNSESIREQIAKQETDCKAIKESFEAAKRETDELKTQLQIIDDFNEDDLLNTENSFRCDKNRNWNKQQEIMHWLNNSDLKHLKDSDEIINAMCNVSQMNFRVVFFFYSENKINFFLIRLFQDTKHKEFLKVDPIQCSKLHEKLLDIEKRLRVTITNSTSTLNNQHSIGKGIQLKKSLLFILISTTSNIHK